MPHRDLHGDSLPLRARARLGSVRLGHQATHLAFTPDGKTLVSAANEGVALWDVGTGKLLGWVAVSGSGLGGLSFLAGGKQLLICQQDGRARIFTVADRQLVRSFAVEGRPTAIALGAAGATLVSVDQGATVRVHDLFTGKEQSRLTDHRAKGIRVSLSPDGKRFASWGVGEAIVVWGVTSGKPLRRLRSRQRLVQSVAFSSDGKSLAACGLAPAVSVWDLLTGEERPRPDGAGGLFSTLAFSPNGKYLAGKGTDRLLRLWSVSSGKVLRHFDLLPFVISSIAFSPDGKTLAACQFHRIHLWNVSTTRPLHDYPGHQGGVVAVGFSGSGKEVVSCGRDRTYRIWDAATGRQRSAWSAPDQVHLSMQIAADGNTIVTPVRDGVLLRPAFGDGGERRIRTRPGSLLDSVSCSSDSHTLVGRGRNEVVRFWDLRTGLESGQLS
jgi:WD40 repeat protein